MNNETILLHLALIDQVGPATIEKVVAGLTKIQNFSLNQLYYLNKKDLIYYANLNENIAQRIVNGLQDKNILNEELNLISKYNIKILSLFDVDYPNWLKQIYLPPIILYIKANQDFKFNQKSIALVGSRKANAYGYKIVNKLIPELVANNYTTVSGGALGIDTQVAQTTLDSKGQTIAVLGSGLLNAYPAINKNLFNKISESGAVISSFALRTSALPGNFPARNRIIAGLSKACVVIEAAKQSGALITAQFALEQGREVCAVPGPIDDPLSEGCHKLISDGAHLITCANDILNILGEEIKITQVSQAPGKSKSNHTNEIKEQNLSILKPQEPKTIQEHILDLAAEPISFDELQYKLNLENLELQSILLNLQLEGLISQNFAGLWQKN